MDVAKIEQNLAMSLAQQIANQLAKCGALFADYDPPADVHNRDGSYLSSACRHAHLQPPKSSTARILSPLQQITLVTFWQPH
jgi:hypothetical protein